MPCRCKQNLQSVTSQKHQKVISRLNPERIKENVDEGKKESERLRGNKSRKDGEIHWVREGGDRKQLCLTEMKVSSLGGWTRMLIRTSHLKQTSTQRQVQVQLPTPRAEADLGHLKMFSSLMNTRMPLLENCCDIRGLKHSRTCCYWKIIIFTPGFHSLFSYDSSTAFYFLFIRLYI